MMIKFQNCRIVYQKDLKAYAIRKGWIFYRYLDLLDTSLWHDFETAQHRMVFCKRSSLVETVLDNLIRGKYES